MDGQAMDKPGVWQVFQLSVIKREFYFVEGFHDPKLTSLQ